MAPLITRILPKSSAVLCRQLLLLTLSVSLLCSQTIDEWIALAERGQLDNVRDHLSDIRQHYGTDPGLIYLSALLEEDGAGAVDQYRDLCDQYPGNPYCHRALLKIAEFYYTSGLYIKSGDWLKKYLRKGPQDKDKKRALKLLERSMTISGNADSVSYYRDLFSGHSPDEKLPVAEPVVPPPNGENKMQPIVSGKGDYAVQVGLFSSIENAGKQLNRLQEKGFAGRISISIKNGKALHAVIIGPYATDADAREISKKIKSGLGLDSFVIKE